MTTLPDAHELESKGFTLRSAMAYVTDRHGPEGRARLLAALSPHARGAYEEGAFPSTWYPFSFQVEVYEAIDRLWGTGDLDLCWEVGRFTADHELSTIHKVFLRVASLDLWMRGAGRLWRNYYSAGALEVDPFQDGRGTIRVVGFNPISKAFCHDFGGWLWRTGELNGLEVLGVDHVACVLDGAPACTYHARWRS